jgi:alkanesulfonate monooxygenase SsuD/methylene tetrahydromethanopterin reductase-like flavin-dependent oxidoreductase (luciferase family)
LQRPHPRIHVGGESDAALRRSARLGEGWIGLQHTFDSVRAPLARLHELLAERSRASESFEISVMAEPNDADELDEWQRLGVTRLIVAPWKRSSQAVAALESFATRFAGAFD